MMERKEASPGYQCQEPHKPVDREPLQEPALGTDVGTFLTPGKGDPYKASLVGDWSCYASGTAVSISQRGASLW